MSSIGNYLNCYSSDDYHQDLKRALELSAQVQNSAKTDYDDFDEEQVKKTIQESLQEENEIRGPNNKKHKSSHSSSSSASESVQDAVTPGVVNSRKRKASKEASPEAKPENRIDAIWKALNDTLPTVLITTVMHYEEDINGIISDILDLQQKNKINKFIRGLAESVTLLDFNSYPPSSEIVNEVVAKLFKNVEVLKMPRSVNGINFNAIIELKNLRELVLNGHHRITDARLAQLVNLSAIRAILLKDIEKIQPKPDTYGIKSLVQNVIKAAMFDKFELLKGIPLSDETIEAIKNIRKLFFEEGSIHQDEILQLATYIYKALLPDDIQEIDKQEVIKTANDYVERRWIVSRDDDDPPTPEEALRAAKKYHFTGITYKLMKDAVFAKDYYDYLRLYR